MKTFEPLAVSPLNYCGLADEPPIFRTQPSYLLADGELTDAQINEMLGMGIPALSPSAGRVAINSLAEGRSVNINTEYRKSGWPSRPDEYNNRWLHNDSRVAAYVFNYEFYDAITENGDLPITST